MLVEGYFDFAQVFQTAGRAGRRLVRHGADARSRRSCSAASRRKVVLSYDPDAAGQGAAARSCELLVAEGFDVNVVGAGSGARSRYVHPAERGRTAIGRNCAARGRIWNTCSIRRRRASISARTSSRRQFLGKMLAVAARIPDPAARDQFGDRIAHKARITEEVVRAEIRKAAVSRRPTLTERELPVVRADEIRRKRADLGSDP